MSSWTPSRSWGQACVFALQSLAGKVSHVLDIDKPSPGWYKRSDFRPHLRLASVWEPQVGLLLGGSLASRQTLAVPRARLLRRPEPLPLGTPRFRLYVSELRSPASCQSRCQAAPRARTSPGPLLYWRSAISPGSEVEQILERENPSDDGFGCQGGNEDLEIRRGASEPA